MEREKVDRRVSYGGWIGGIVGLLALVSSVSDMQSHSRIYNAFEQEWFQSLSDRGLQELAAYGPLERPPKRVDRVLIWAKEHQIQQYNDYSSNGNVAGGKMLLGFAGIASFISLTVLNRVPKRKIE